jgi:hypothetical protein
MALKQTAGWNQTPDDWRMILETSQGGSYAAVVNEIPVGTITTVSYPPHFSWLGMLLVHPEYRKKGIGSDLLKAAIHYAQNIGAVQLDATPAGKPIYLRLGFVEECELVRMVRPPEEFDYTAAIPTHRIEASAMTNICLYDHPLFGASRSIILRWLYRSAPQYSFYTSQDTGTEQDMNKITGFCLGRSGTRYEQIGPIVAENGETAYSLLLSALNACSLNNVIVDVPVSNSEWLNFLTHAGFVQHRFYTRMTLGGSQRFGKPDNIFAIAGPEIG